MNRHLLALPLLLFVFLFAGCGAENVHDSVSGGTDALRHPERMETSKLREKARSGLERAKQAGERARVQHKRLSLRSARRVRARIERETRERLANQRQPVRRLRCPLPQLEGFSVTVRCRGELKSGRQVTVPVRLFPGLGFRVGRPVVE